MNEGGRWAWPCNVTLWLTVACIVGTAVAQMPAAPKFVCPSTGYFPPMYGTVPRNGGDGSAPTEGGNPCNPPEVVAAADGLGMQRAIFGSPVGLKNLVTYMFTATGDFAVDGRKPVAVEQLDFQVHYGLPAARLMIKRGGKLDIRVFNDALSWTETAEGVGGKDRPDLAADLLLLTKLTPFGVLWTEIEAEGHVKVLTENGHTILVGTSPYDGIEVRTVLDDKSRPATVAIKYGGVNYGASFQDYRNDLDVVDEWVPFPRRIVWTRNGRPYADLTVTGVVSNPYVVFPTPAQMRKAVAEQLAAASK